MDIEFHYYMTFLIAGKAGFGEEDAFTIAYASQYVDDNDTGPNTSYTPANGAHWVDPDPTNVQDALDRIAASINADRGPVA